MFSLRTLSSFVLNFWVFIQTLWFVPSFSFKLYVFVPNVSFKLYDSFQTFRSNFMIHSELYDLFWTFHSMNSIQTLSVIMNFFIAKIVLLFKFATEIIRTLRRQCCFMRLKLLWKVKTVFQFKLYEFHSVFMRWTFKL